MSFDDNRLLPLLVGEHNSHLHYIEDLIDVEIVHRGNTLLINGPSKAVHTAQDVLEMLTRKLEQKHEVTIGEVDAAIRFARGETHGAEGNGKPVEKEKFFDTRTTLQTRKASPVTPRTPNQGAYIEAIQNNDMVFGIGPAGTGKTYLAVALAVSMYLEGKIERMVFCRPAVEAGERLGFLPGDMMEKIDPYLRPIYDALHDMLPAEMIQNKMESGDIEIAPLAFMRGRTLKNAFIVLDEAQNTTSMQMKMFLTRMGEGTRMVVTGDPTQIDLPPGTASGLKEAMTILNNVEGISFIQFTSRDVIRHKLVSRIIEAYDAHEFRGTRHTR